MSLTLDVPRCREALRAHLLAALKALADEYVKEAQSHMLTEQGRSDIALGEVEEVADWIAATVVGGAWAVMDEWGTGSLMDTSNPALDRYRHSIYWNPYRGKHGPEDTAIRSRERGPYTNIFGEQQVSRAPRPGINLERLAQEGRLRTHLHLTPPSHAMHTAARWLRETRVQRVLAQVLEGFPWGKFLVADPDA